MRAIRERARLVMEQVPGTSLSTLMQSLDQTQEHIISILL